MTMTVNYNELLSAPDSKALEQVVETYAREMKGTNVPPATDLYLNIGRGGHYLLEEIGQREQDEMYLPIEDRMTWRFLCVSDKWGNVPNPGDIVKRKVQKPFKNKKGQPIPGSELSTDKAIGDFDEKWINYREYRVDDKGCISVGHTDAMYFVNFSMHYKTKKAVNPRYRKPSLEAVKAPDGQSYQIHYLKFREVTSDQYRELPKREKSKIPKRGWAK